MSACMTPQLRSASGSCNDLTKNGLRCRTSTPGSTTYTSFIKSFPSINERTVTRRMKSATLPDICHARPVYNKVRETLYARFSPDDWNLSNQTNVNISENQRHEAEALKTDAWRAMKVYDQKTRNRQSDVTKKLGERVKDIVLMKNELEIESRAMEYEQELLKNHLKLLEIALEHTKKPLAIAKQCLSNRENRIGIDLVHDDVEKQLTKEVEGITNCQAAIQKMIENVKIQDKYNQCILHELDKDIRDKLQAINVDDRMFHLKNSSPGIDFHKGIELIDNTISIPESWFRYSQENIKRAQRMRAQSEMLRGAIEQKLRSCANDMWSQFNNVNNAFKTRIQDTINARNNLQMHLQKNLKEINDIDNTMQLLRDAIADKELPLKVAETRLDERTKRLNVELCNDPVMKTLQKEVAEIRQSMKALKDRLKAAETSYIKLNKAKDILENDIKVKENSITIDQKMCMGMRTAFPMDSKLSPIFNVPLGP